MKHMIHKPEPPQPTVSLTGLTVHELQLLCVGIGRMLGGTPGVNDLYLGLAAALQGATGQRSVPQAIKNSIKFVRSS